MADPEPRNALEEWQQQQNEAAGILPPDKRPPPIVDTTQAKEDAKPSEKPSESPGGGSTSPAPKQSSAVDNFNDHYYRFNPPPKEDEKKLDGTAPIKGAVEPEFDAPSTKDIKLDAATGSNTIKVGDTLGPNKELVSDNERYAVRFQDGNLVFIDKVLRQKVLQSGTENGSTSVTGARFDKDSIDILGGQNLAKGDKGRALWSQGFEFDKSIVDKIKAYRINDDGTIVALGGKDNKEVLGVAYYMGDQKKHFIPVDFPVPPGGSEFFYDTVETMRRIMQLQVDKLGAGQPSGAPNPERELKNAGLPTGEFTSEMVKAYRGNHEKIESLNLALADRLEKVKILTKDLANEVRDAKKYIEGKLEELGQVMRSPMWVSSRPWGQTLEELKEEKKTRVQRTYDKDGNVTSFELSKELEQKLLEALRSTSLDISKRIAKVDDFVKGAKPPKGTTEKPKGPPAGKDDSKGNGNGNGDTTPHGPAPQGPGTPGPTQTGPGPNQNGNNTPGGLPPGPTGPGGTTAPGATDPKLAKFFNDLANDIEKIGSGAGGSTGDGAGSGGGTGSSGGGTPGGQTPGGTDKPGGQNQPGSPSGGTGQPQPQPGQQQGGGGGMNLGLPLMMMLGTLPQMIGQAAQMMMAQKAEQEERERQEEERRLEREERKADEEAATAQASAEAPGGAPAPGEAAPPVAAASYGPGAPPPVVMPGGMIDAPLPDGTTQKVPAAVAQALNKEIYNANGSDANAAYAGTTGQQTPSNPWTAVDPNSTDPDKRLRTGDVIQWENRSALVVMNESGLNVLLNGQLVQLDPHNPPDDGHGPFGRFQGFFHPSGIDKAGGDLAAGAQPTVDVAPDGGAPPQPKPVRPQVYT
ncbi:hypothetical protein FEK35_10920 [Nocardia cyriacigeorgica]|uniref:Uncharacterized protein n=1 Tax=Nocardia cyriacigeorgica TaxID=135487 RepID=A0A5R8PFY1_9NOCA|nr:hypothetical protein [Nocardia cyriacigeorgica]TLG12419.1 hypothetical protein FEK35_10920 [Nocardia cyriacigeorgica]